MWGFKKLATRGGGGGGENTCFQLKVPSKFITNRKKPKSQKGRDFAKHPTGFHFQLKMLMWFYILHFKHCKKENSFSRNLAGCFFHGRRLYRMNPIR